MSAKRNSVTVVIFLLCVAGIGVLIFLPRAEQKPQERPRTRVIVPTTVEDPQSASFFVEQMSYEESYSLKAPLDDNELALSVLNIDFDNDSIEEQVVAFRSQIGSENQVAITLFSFDERSRQYRRLWNNPVAALTPGTVSLYTQDLLGDRSDCIIVTGMNIQGDHTMTVFRKENQSGKNQPFAVIAAIRISGSITVQETERPLAYQQSIANGQPFVIIASGHDGESDNILDRVEISYAYNSARRIYEQSAISRVPGSQIEERRLREILTGEPKVFENFIDDLWYHVTPQGTIDRGQYLYFDPEKREIIFFGDGTQQVFAWNYSNSTRYGLFISSQNISVTTLRRFLNIELESLDSISMRVNEDIRLKIGLSASWDGSYRRAGAAAYALTESRVDPYTDAVYDSSMGRLRFYENGEYELTSSGTLLKGHYAFFRAGRYNLLELRPVNGINGAQNGGDNRLVYLCTGMEITGDGNSANLSLSRVRLGTSGIQEMHEAPIMLTKVL
jgi:hypothetical protein